MKTFSITIPTKTDLVATSQTLRRSIYHSYLKKEDRLYKKMGQRLWRLSYKLRGRCGSSMSSHYPVYGNSHTWLWKTTPKFKTCQICGEKIRITATLRSAYKPFSNIGREADMASLEKMYKTATNEEERTAVKHSISKIAHEDKRARAMRDDLIKAHREGDHTKIKDIHDYIVSKKVYTNE